MFRTIVSAIALFWTLAAAPGLAQVFDHSPATTWSGTASAETQAAQTQSSRTTLYNLVMTRIRPESINVDSFGSNAKCRKARNVTTENLIFLGVNDQTERQVYVWCDVPRKGRRRKARK